jgi:predicted acylesterase/phospholipase RssA
VGITALPTIVGGDTQGQITLFVYGDDGQVWAVQQDPTNPANWAGWVPLGAPPSGLGSNLIFASSVGSQLNVVSLFTIGYNDGALWAIWPDAAAPNGWSSWVSLGFPGTRMYSVTSYCIGANADGRLEGFAFDVNGALWHLWLQPTWVNPSGWQAVRTGGGPDSGWSMWVQLTTAAGSPTPTIGGAFTPQYGELGAMLTNSDGNGNLELYLIDGTGTLWGRGQAAVVPTPSLPTWSNWMNLGAAPTAFSQAAGSLTAGRNADGREELFAVDADGEVWHSWNSIEQPTGGTANIGLLAPWGSWAPIGTDSVSNIAVVSNPDGRLELFGILTSSGLLSHVWEVAPNTDTFVGVTQTTAIVLSGGGAKGDFEVGALNFLYGAGISPQLLCGTSVGAINAAKLAEGTPTSLSELTQFWLELMQNQDMFLEENWVIQSPLRPAIESLFSSGSSSGSIGPIIALSFWQNVLLALPIAGDIAINVAGSEINNAVQALGAAPCSSVYNLDPIITMLRQNLNTGAIASSGIKLRLGSTCLEDGGLHYVTEAGVLVDDPTVPPVALMTAVLASSSIPAIFPPVAMFGRSWVDGGVRNATPLDAALQLGANPIYVIVASQAAVDPAPTFISQGILSIAGRAIFDIMPNALQQYLIAPPPEGVTLIQPSFDVHSSLVVDPGLISISMAYGYMRAAEIQAFGSLNNPLSPLSDQIIQARLKCWSMENTAFAADQYAWIVSNQTNPPISQPPLTPTDDGSTFGNLRNAKLAVRNLLCQYENAAGFSPSFLPSTDFRRPAELALLSSFGPPFNSTGVAAWWMQFERHPYTPTPATPWSSFADGSGRVVPPIPAATVTSLLNPCTPVTPFPSFQDSD